MSSPNAEAEGRRRMLVLSRVIGESVVIGNFAEVSVARINNDSVGLMIRSLADGAERLQTLHLQEQMRIDDKVQITAIDIQVSEQLKKVRLGFEGSQQVPIYRKELMPPND